MKAVEPVAVSQGCETVRVLEESSGDKVLRLTGSDAVGRRLSAKVSVKPGCRIKVRIRREIFLRPKELDVFGIFRRQLSELF